jgi:hypothetical protein
MTRWHEDDIAGRILPENWNGESGWFNGRDGMRWRVLCLQARCETHTDPLGRKLGEYLWPEWFGRQFPGEPERYWREYEKNRTLWASMCQQIPRPPEGAFFLRDSFLVDKLLPDGTTVRAPVEIIEVCRGVFAIIDTAIKTGKGHDGTGVVYHAIMPVDFTAFKLCVLDWDYIQIEGGKMEAWLPSVFARLEQLARECHALMGVIGTFIEDKQSGTVLLQQAANKGWPATAIDSKLTSMGKTERAFNAEPYVSAGDVKILRGAHDKVVTFKETTKNHFFSQVLSFALDDKENTADDLTDCLTYGVAIGIGGREGF